MKQHDDRDESTFTPIWADVPSTLQFCCVGGDPFPQVAGEIKFMVGIADTPTVEIHIENVVGPIEFRSAEPGFDPSTFSESNPILVKNPTDAAPGWLWSGGSAYLTYTRSDGTNERISTMDGGGQSQQIVPGQVLESRDPDWR